MRNRNDMKWILLTVEPGVFAHVLRSYEDNSVTARYYLDGIVYTTTLYNEEYIEWNSDGHASR